MLLLLAAPLAAALLFASPAVAVPDGGLADVPDASAPSADGGASEPAPVEKSSVDTPVPPADQAEKVATEEPPPAPPSDAPDDPSIAKKIDEVSREMEELRAAEAAVVDEGAKRAAETFKAMRRAGQGSPLHQRMSDALGAGRALPIVPDETEMEAAALAEIGSFDIEKAKKLYDIPVEMQPLVAEYIRFFQVSVRSHFVRWLSRSFHYIPMMKKALREAGLPEDTVYLSMIESGFAPIAFSRAKAAGLWQFIEATGKRFGLRIDFWEDERRDPVKSTYAAAAYLKELYTEFGDWRLAWAGYNAGAGSVRRAIQIEGTTDFWKLIESRRAFHPETKHYVPKLIAAALISKHLKFFGFAEPEYQPQPELAYEDVEVPEATDLEIVARAAGVTLEELKDLNPALRRWCTPPSRKNSDVYRIHLPVGSKERFAQEFPKIAPKDRMYFVVHGVGKGDTLSRIAARYGSATEAIMRMNGLHDSRHLRMNAELVVPVPRTGSKESLAVAARRQGFRAAPTDQEVPAAPPVPRRTKGGVAAGSIRTVQEKGRMKTLYGVAEGDSLWTISRKFNVKLAQLKEWNDFEGSNVKLRIGQEIAVYPDAKQAEEKPAARAPGNAVLAPEVGKRPGVHVVEPGDTLWSLSHRYKVSVEDLKRWNNLGKKKLKIGQPLAIRPPEEA